MTPPVTFQFGCHNELIISKIEIVPMVGSFTGKFQIV